MKLYKVTCKGLKEKELMPDLTEYTFKKLAEVYKEKDDRLIDDFEKYTEGYRPSLELRIEFLEQRLLIASCMILVLATKLGEQNGPKEFDTSET